VQVIRSGAAAPSQAAALDRRLKQAEAAVRDLTPPPGPGRTRYTTGWELERAVNAVLAEQDAKGLLTVSWERQETSRTHHVGPGRGGPNRRKTTERSVRSQITAVTRDDAAIECLVERMGWQVQVTNAPAARLSLGDAVLGYRAGTCVERAFHQLKDQPLGIRPRFVHRDDQVRGLTHLLTLALRVLTLFEVLVRRGQDQDGEGLAGLYPGQAKRTTDRPTAQRVLEGVRPKFDVKPIRSSFSRRQGIPTDLPSTRTDSIAPLCSSTTSGSAPPPHHPPTTSSPSHTTAA
jgi:hypothetical protein